MVSACLDAMPVEFLDRITDSLKRHDVSSLSRTSRALHANAFPSLYRGVDIRHQSGQLRGSLQNIFSPRSQNLRHMVCLHFNLHDSPTLLADWV